MYTDTDDTAIYKVSRYEGDREHHELVTGRHEAVRQAGTRSPEWPGAAYITGQLVKRPVVWSLDREWVLHSSFAPNSFDHYEVAEGDTAETFVAQLNEPDHEYDELCRAEQRILYPLHRS